jgi:hypothetical protein
VLHGEGEALGKLGRHGEAHGAFRKAVEHQRRAFTQAPEVTSYRGSLSKHYAELARVARELADEAEASVAAREGQALRPADPVPGAKPNAGSPDDRSGEEGSMEHQPLEHRLSRISTMNPATRLRWTALLSTAVNIDCYEGSPCCNPRSA